MAKNTKLPFDKIKATEILDEFGSPLHLYDESGIRLKAKKIKNEFKWAPEYKNYYAVKACPNPSILKILHSEGMGFDCSSYTELLLMKRLGIKGKDIFFTSNNTPAKDFELAIELDATVNIDDLSQVSTFLNTLKDRNLTRVACRYNPGDLKSGNTIIGEPTEAKYGLSIGGLIKAFSLLKDSGIKYFGLHTMVASNELDPAYFQDTTKLLLDAIAEIEEKTEIKFSFINLGGGFGVNYLPNQSEFDISVASKLIKDEIDKSGRKIQLFTEHGRYVTGAHGYLLCKVQYVMEKYKTYIGLDASMHNLMRPGMYGAYHHITVLGKENDKVSHTYDVVGSLCENNDKFAIDRLLPEIEVGDIIAIHDTGAHGHSMGFNYNGLLRSAEALIRENGSCKLIRRAETPDDYFSTLIW